MSTAELTKLIQLKTCNITTLDLWLDFQNQQCEKLKFPVLANKVKGSNLKTY